MSKRGKLLKVAKDLVGQQGKINVGLKETFEELGKLPSSDHLWFLRKLVKSSEFRSLPGELPQQIAQDLANIEHALRGINPKALDGVDDDDDLPF